MHLVNSIAVALIALYLGLLLGLNLIPHLRVGAFGYGTIRKITLKHPQLTVSIDKLSFNLSWARVVSSPFRAVSLHFSGVVIEKQYAEKASSGGKDPNDGLSHIARDTVSVLLPNWVYRYLFQKGWLNELAVQFHDVSIYHHWVDKEVSLHLTFVKIENAGDFCASTNKFSVSVIDGYIKSNSADLDDGNLRLFHNLEMAVACTFAFSSPLEHRSKTKMSVSNLKLLLAFGDLHIRKSSLILDKLRKGSSPKKERRAPPPMHVVLGHLKIVSSLQIKLEQCVIDFKELRLESSSFSLTYDRDESFKHVTTAKISTWFTAAKLFHKDMACVELPSLTCIFEVDLTDFVRASVSDDKKNFQVDTSLIATVTNPSFSVFYDQISYLFDNLNPRSQKKETEGHIRDTDFVKRLVDVSKHIRKGAIKLNVTDLAAELHTPKEEGHEFNRRSMENVVTHAGFQSFMFQTSSKNVGDIIARNLACKSPVTLKSFMKLRKLYVEVEENEIYITGLRSLVGVSLHTQKITLKVACNSVQVKSVNTIIFHVIRKIRELRISASNSACAKLASEPPAKSSAEDQLHHEVVSIFELLPPIVHSVKFSINSISSSIICKDFLPSHTVYNLDRDEHIDLAAIKRGISLVAGGFEVQFNRDKHIFGAKLNELEATTLSDYAGESLAEDDDAASSLSEDILSDISSLDSNMSEGSLADARQKEHEVKRVVAMRNLLVKTPRDQDKLLLTINEVDGQIDTFLFWCIFYAKSMVMMIAPKIELQYTHEELERATTKRIVNLDIEVNSLSVKARVANDVDILLELDKLHFTDTAVSPHCQIRYTRLYVVHPTTKLWSRLVSISNTFVDLGTVSRKSIDVDCRKVRFNIPFQFLVYTVIDNVITFAKAIIQIEANFKNLSTDIKSYKRIEPQAREAVSVPRIHVKSSVFGITLENDVFESELALILEFNKFEMIERRRKEAIFRKKAEALRKKAKEGPKVPAAGSKKAPEPEKKFPKRVTNLFTKGDHTDSSSSQHSGPPWQKKSILFGKKEDMKRTDSMATSHSSHATNSKTSADAEKEKEKEKEYLSEEETEKLISDAHDELQKDIGISYIHKFRRFRKSKLDTWKDRMEQIWGEDRVSELFRSKFEVQEYAPGPPQFHGGFSDLDLVIEDPKIPDLHDFLNKYGKGQPRLDYSILVPLSIDLRSKAVYLCARDYELPLLSFPQSDQIDSPVMELKTTLVINEKLISLQEELRHIFVPFSPATYWQVKESRENVKPDNFYSMNVIRTLTPVKMMFDLECNLNSDRACIVSWCKSYQPAMSTIMMAFENFTKPEIDDSPLGWWDKMSLIMHGKARFNVKNELCVHIKSSQSPYALSGHNSGLVFCWKDNVEVKINETGKRTELLVVQSDGFILGIPSYAATEGKSWSLLASLARRSGDDDDSDAGKFQKRLVKLSSDEKVVWTVGCLFERNKDKDCKELSSSMERIHDFKPHYDVVVTGPQYDYHPDSFEEFRSDYLHLALSVKSASSKGNAHNVGYLTPMTLDHLGIWWKTLNDIVSTPIREGKLFANSPFKESSVKFGPHLFTFKYQIILEPLTMSHTYLSSGGKELNHSVVAYGAKGRCSKCIIDLHQRREVARYVNENLSIDKKIRKLKMNIGEVEITDADIRLVFCQFNDVSMSGKLLSYYTGESNSSVNVENFEGHLREQSMNFKSKSGLNVEEGDPSWVDYDDFIELEEQEVLAPDLTIKISPFFFTPRFTYLRNFTLEPEDAPFPFGDEPVVACFIGSNSPDVIQAQLVEERTKKIKRKLEHDRSHMEGLGGDRDAERREQYEKEIANGESRVNKLSALSEEIKSLSREPSLAGRGQDSGESQEHTRRGSVASAYSGYKSLEQAREISDLSDPMFKDFHNRFVIHNLKLRWTNQIRDTFTAFLSVIGDRKTDKLGMSRKALDLLSRMMSMTDEPEKTRSSKTAVNSEGKFTCGNDIIESFEEYLMDLQQDGYEIESKYLVKFIQPQVHLSSDQNPDSRVLMTSDDIELRVLAVDVEGADNIIRDSNQQSSLIETRYGVLLRDTHFFVFEHSDGFTESCRVDPYSLRESHDTRTPWLQIEDCGEAAVFQDNLVAERTTMALCFKKPNMLSMEPTSEAKRSEIVVHLAKLVVTATSSQYSALYFLMTDLLIQRNEKNFLRQKIDKISSVSEAADFEELSDKVKMLQSNIRISSYTLLKLRHSTKKLSDLRRRQERHISLEIARMRIELMIIIKSLEAVCSRSDGAFSNTRNWVLNTDQLIIHFLEDSRVPLADFALAASKFTRVEESNGSNSNHLEVSMVQGFNLQKHAPYPELLKPLLDAAKDALDSETKLLAKPMIEMKWSMLHPVGGIRVMKHANLAVQPMHIQLDFDTTTKLFNYLFPKDDAKPESESPKKRESPRKREPDDDSSRSRSSSDVSSSRPHKSLWQVLNKSGRSGHDGSSVFSESSSGARDSFAESRSLGSERSSSGFELLGAAKAKSRHAKKKQKDSDDLSLIMKRSAEYLVVENFSLGQIDLRLSFKAPKHLNIIDVHNLAFTFPEISYRDKTWTSQDMAVQLKKDVVKVFLAHSGKILGNKFKQRKRTYNHEHVRQISDYSHYVSLEELQKQDAAAKERTPPPKRRSPPSRSPLPNVVVNANYEELLDKPE